jgi:ubiquinone/menaquinone biosynthesis C-methylase UbiE
MSEAISAGFQNADNADIDFLTKFLEDVNKMPTVVASFKKQLELLNIQPGCSVLDIGCGIGDRAEEMAALVGPNGRVCGTDLSNLMIEIANRRTKDKELPLEFRVASAVDQPFPDESFDCVRTERVLMYLPDPEPAIDEFLRVMKPGGRLVVLDFDWDALIFSHQDQVLTRRIVDYISDSFPNGRVGVHLNRMFRKKGLLNVQAIPVGYVASYEMARRVCGGILDTGVESGAFAADTIANWWSDVEADSAVGHHLISFQGFITCGVKPL